MNNSDKKLVLSVDDNVLIALTSKKDLEDYEYNVIVAHTGEEAIEIVKNNKEINLILMDIDLGDGIDGPEAAKQILSIRDLPIIFCSNHSEKKYIDKLKTITRYGFVLKDSGSFVLQSSVEMAFELFDKNQQIKKNIKQLQKSEEKFRVLVENMSDMVFLIDVNLKIISMNQATLDIFDKKNENVIGKPISALFPPQISETYQTLLRKVITTSKQLTQDSNLLIRGKNILISTKFNPIFNKKGKIKSIIGVSRDITKRKKDELKKAKLIKELEEKINNNDIIEGYLPICANCNKIRDEQGEWQPVVHYLTMHTKLKFTHGLCLDCANELYGEEFVDSCFKDDDE